MLSVAVGVCVDVLVSSSIFCLFAPSSCCPEVCASLFENSVEDTVLGVSFFKYLSMTGSSFALLDSSLFVSFVLLFCGAVISPPFGTARLVDPFVFVSFFSPSASSFYMEINILDNEIFSKKKILFYVIMDFEIILNIIL